MKKEYLKVGDKVFLDHWEPDKYIEVFPGYVRYHDGTLSGFDEFADDARFQYWTPLKEKREPETWYRFEYKAVNERPYSFDRWYKDKDSFMKDTNVSSNYVFDIEPRVYEEREF